MAASMPAIALASTASLPDSPAREVFAMSPIPARQPDLSDEEIAPGEDPAVAASVAEAGVRTHNDVEIAPGEDPAVAASVAEAEERTHTAVAIAPGEEAGLECRPCLAVGLQPGVYHSFVNVAPTGMMKMQPVCKNCLRTVDPMKKGVRISSKKEETFVCEACNSKTTSMTRVTGTWPTVEFNGLSAQSKVDFWRCDGGLGKYKLKYAEEVAKHLIERKINGRRGQSLPLGVLAVQGHDIERIRLNTPPEDIEDNPQLGKCYMVRIKTQDDEREEQMIKSQMMEKMGRSKKIKEILASAAPSKGVVPSDEEKASDPSSSSSGSGKARSSKTKKDNKQKQKHLKEKAEKEKELKQQAAEKDRAAKAALKDKKAKTKVDQDQARAAKKMKKDVLELCCKAVAKLQPMVDEVRGMVYTIDGTLTAKAADLPTHLLQSTEMTYKRCHEIYLSASHRMQNPDALTLYTVEDVKVAAANIATTILATKPYLQ